MRAGIAAVLMMCWASTFAAVSDVPDLNTQQAEQCREISNFARAIMAARQKGIPMVQVLDTLKQSGTAHLIGPMQSIAQDAYSRPQPAAEIDRQKAVQDFGNEAFASCAKAQAQKQPAQRPRR